MTTREANVHEAQSWLGTPYHVGARVKGAGVDCATFLFAVYKECGLVPAEEEGVFTSDVQHPDWWAHTSEEKYMFRIIRHAHKVVEAISYATLDAKPGNIVLSRAAGSRVYNHGAVVVRWPMVIHAVDPVVEVVDASTNWMWSFQTVAVFDPFEPLEKKQC